jgi:hypothetical protein
LGSVVPSGWRAALSRAGLPGSETRAILHYLLEHGDLAGRDASGGTLITLAVDDRLLERLLTFNAGFEDLEDGGDVEPDDQEQVDTPHR